MHHCRHSHCGGWAVLGAGWAQVSEECAHSIQEIRPRPKHGMYNNQAAAALPLSLVLLADTASLSSLPSPAPHSKQQRTTYTLGALHVCFKCSDMQYSEYMNHAREAGVERVIHPDRKIVRPSSTRHAVPPFWLPKSTHGPALSPSHVCTPGARVPERHQCSTGQNGCNCGRRDGGSEQEAKAGDGAAVSVGEAGAGSVRSRPRGSPGPVWL